MNRKPNIEGMVLVMKHVYPALFTECKEGGYAIWFPDLPGTNTQGKDLYDALCMAELSLTEWLEYLADKNMVIPAASRIEEICPEAGQFVSLIRTRDTKAS